MRTLAEDLGAALGCGAHVTALRRRAAGPFDEAQAIDFDALEAEAGNLARDAYLLPVASAVTDWPELRLNADTAYYLCQGQPVIVPHAPSSGWVRLTRLPEPEEDRGTVAGPAGTNAASTEDACAFLGVGEVLDDGRVAPRRLVVRS